MRTILIIASSVLVSIAPLFYIYSILTGEARPHRTTRFVLVVIGVVVLLSLWGECGSAAFWLALLSAIEGLILFVLSMFKGVGGWEPLDIACLVLALLGVVVWRLSSQPVLALMVSVFADFVGCVPTIIKEYYAPRSEDWRFYAVGAAGSFCSLLAVNSTSLMLLAFPLYLTLVNAFMAGLALPARKSFIATNDDA